ncbi:MAG TPA: energy transducer TonB, partial [Nitrospiraceae bacterium]|nr:energy transducer TonB [Nitrospiraceae bacterium]
VVLAVAVCFVAGLHSAASAAMQPSAPPVKRWVQFELMESEKSGVVRVDKDLVLSITVGGISSSADSILAVIESPVFQSQTVSLSQDSNPATYQGTAILEPKSTSKSLTTVHPKATRIRVTLARAKASGLEEFMKRDVYITLGEPTEGDGEDEVDSPKLVMPEEAEPDSPPAAKPAGAGPAAHVAIAEEDLLPLPEPAEAEAYWKQVSGLISRNWSRQVRQIRRAPSGETVRVRFKLYSSGVAQLIQVEKSSGARDINEAGIQTIIHAHPFPPLPADMSGELVDVHVRMRTGAKVGPADVETTVEKRSAKGPPTRKSQSQ